MKKICIVVLAFLAGEVVFASNSVLLSVRKNEGEEKTKLVLDNEKDINRSNGRGNSFVKGELVAEKGKPSLLTVGKIVKGEQFKEQLVKVSGKFKLFQFDGRVEFEMIPGRLKRQVIELLLNHDRIDDMGDIQWHASDNFIWPNAHILAGESIDHVLNDLLEPYRLVAEFKGNGNVVIERL